MAYNLNATIRVTALFRVSGVATDPTTVSLAVTTPAGATTTYTYGGGTVTKASTGSYYKDLNASSAGQWTYVFTGTGAAADTHTGTFDVGDTGVAPTTSLLTIIEEVADTLAGRDFGVATSGTLTTLVCGNYPFATSIATADATRYVGSEVYIASGTATAQARQIVGYTAATGTFDISPAFTTAPGAGNKFDIFTRDLTHDSIKSAINACLREMRYVSRVPLSLVADGDMERADVGHWAGTNATPTKITGLRGKYSLRVLNSGANGFVQSDTIPCSPDDGFIVQTRPRAIVGAGTLQAYDVTNSAVIDSGSWTALGWGGIQFSFNTPSTCKAIAIRLKGSGASDDIYWDNVQLLRQGAVEIPLPASVVREGQVLRVMQASAEEEYDTDQYFPITDYEIQPDYSNPTSRYKLRLHSSVSNPIWVDLALPYPELSADGDATTCDREWIVVAATVKVLDRLINRGPAKEVEAWRQEYYRKRKRLMYLNGALQPKPRFRMGFGEPAISPTNRGI
jgi:hypothetical protein